MKRIVIVGLLLAAMALWGDEVVEILPGRTRLYMATRLGERINRFPEPGGKGAAIKPWIARKDGLFELERFGSGLYPSIFQTMPFLTFNDGERGVYLGVHDATSAPVGFNVVYDAAAKTCRVSTFGVGDSGLPAPTLVRCDYTGTWHESARVFRRWWDAVKTPVRSPAFVRDTTGMFLVILKQQNGEIIWPYTDFRVLGDAIVAHGMNLVGLFGWGVGGHDHLYPDYEPDPTMGGRVALVQGIEHLKSRGIRVFLYANGQLQERDQSAYWRELGQYNAVIRRDGSRVGETWHKYLDSEPHHFDIACLWARPWYDRMLALAMQAHAFGADGILYDQLGVRAPTTCWGEGHGHAKGALAYAGERVKFLKGIADTMRLVDPRFIVLTEGFHASLVDSISFYHGWGPGVDYFTSDTFGQRGQRVMDRFPEFVRFTLPEVVTSSRVPTPVLSRTMVNYSALLGLRHELEIRYTPDRQYIEHGTKPTKEAYGTIRQKPALGKMMENDHIATRDYLRSVCEVQAKLADPFLRGTFKDVEGFTLVGEGVVAKRHSGEAFDGVVVWNFGGKPADFSIAGLGAVRDAVEPGRGAVEPFSPLAPDSIRFIRFEHQAEKEMSK